MGGTTARVTTPAGLRELAATLHDARFTADAIAFHQAAQAFTLTCWVLGPPKAGALRRWQGYQVSFENVADCKVNTKEKVRYYELATIRFSEPEGKLNLVAHYGIEISLTVSRLDGVLAETGQTRDKWE